MPDISALAKYPCAACGAQAEWNPAKQLLVCPFCGTSTPFKVDEATGSIEEIDLAKTLRELPDEQRGWMTEKRTVQCQSCKAVTVFDPDRVGQNCEFCGSPALVDYTEIKAPIRPQSLLPFKVSQAQVREQMRAWYASKWLAPNAFKSQGAGRSRPWPLHSVLDVRRAGRLPLGCGCRALLLHDRDRSAERTHRDASGPSRPMGAGVRRGQHFFDDEPVPGTQGIPLSLLKQVEPFPTTDLVPYTTAFLSGFVVEHYQVVLFDAAQRSQEADDGSSCSEMAAAQIPGDTYRNLQIHPAFSNQTFKHVLVPVWLLTYNYGARAFQLVVNGYTGRMAGEYPKSAWKIALLVLLALIVLMIFLYLQD